MNAYIFGGVTVLKCDRRDCRGGLFTFGVLAARGPFQGDIVLPLLGVGVTEPFNIPFIFRYDFIIARRCFPIPRSFDSSSNER